MSSPALGPLAPDSIPASLCVPAPRRTTRIDWPRVAALLAEGRTTAEVARAVGCSRQHVWRLMRRSRRLQGAIADAEGLVGADANGRLAGLRPAVAEALARELGDGNVRVVLWLADRLGLGQGRDGAARDRIRGEAPTMTHEDWLKLLG